MTRRMMFLVGALLGIMVFAVTVSPPDDGGNSGPSSPPARTTADDDAFDVSVTLDAAASAQEETIEAKVGDRVQIIVEGDEPANVLLEELRTEPLDAGSPARFELLAETPGAYPLVLLEEDRRIGTLEIQ
jgi:hypothetical protein